MTTQIRKTIDRIFILRVSGKGDEKGSANQVQVLQQYRDFPDVVTFLETFDPRMMKASSQKGARLRQQWKHRHGLVELNRAGRRDFLGVSVVIGRSRFIVYAATAAYLDEVTGNAFTRHVCEAIGDPAFHGLGDPEFMAARDAGGFDSGEHPSIVYAFDPTRFIRSMGSAILLYDAAVRDRAAFEAKDLHIDPAQGDHMRLMWTFIAYGSEMEATVGKQRRFVGRLNKARAGHWPYREGMVPLGGRRVAVPDREDTYELGVDDRNVASVAALAEVGLRPDATNAEILRVLAARGVTSGDPKTLGVPVDQLDPAAAKRFYLRRKLEAYRDGWLELHFLGVTENAFRPGSGHLLTRRWEGLNAAGQPDRLGSVTYRVRFPKPTVTDPDGHPREGWIDGITDAEERARWNRLIALRGVDDDGKRPVEETDAEVRTELSAADLARLEDELARAQRRERGGRPAERVISRVCRPYWDTEDGPRAFLRTRGRSGCRDGGPMVTCELRRETGRPGRSGGIRRGEGASELLATFAESDVTAALAAVITAAVRTLTDGGHQLAPHQVLLSPGLAEQAGCADPVARRAAEERALIDRVAAARRLAKGCDLHVAALRGEGLADDDERLTDARHSAAEAWRAWQSARDELQALQAAALPVAPADALPPLDAADARDLVVGLRGVFATGAAPAGFLDMLQFTLPRVRFEPGGDALQWQLVGDVMLTTTTGETVTVTGCRAEIVSRHGRGGAGGSAGRATDMAARRMRDGQPLPEIARAAGSDVGYVTRQITAALRGSGAFPDDARLAQAVGCPVPDATRVLWEHATGAPTVGTPGAGRQAFRDHLVSVYTGSRGDRPASGRGAVWAYDLDVDLRRDQLTIVIAAADATRGVRADALTHMLDPDDPRPRRVLDASTDTVKVNGVYPPVLRRLPAPVHPDGWHGRAAASLAAEHKRVGLTPCPYNDCDEQYATVLVPAVEVLTLGTMLLCRRCRRAATPPHHEMFAAARRIRFPQAYIRWYDAQPHRPGHIAACARPGCQRDVGLGGGYTWQWDDTAGPAWHDDDCRAGRPTAAYTRCRHTGCTLDEGAGPGSIRQEGRGRRAWHARQCQYAESRRATAEKIEFATCRLPGCTLDEGGGPGSIRKNGKHRTVHNDTCQRSPRPGSGATVIRQWARDNGHRVRDSGRLPVPIVAAYRAAHGDDAT